MFNDNLKIQNLFENNDVLRFLYKNVGIFSLQNQTSIFITLTWKKTFTNKGFFSLTQYSLQIQVSKFRNQSVLKFRKTSENCSEKTISRIIIYKDLSPNFTPTFKQKSESID